MKEIAACLGPERNLVSVLTVPERSPKLVAVLLFNAGVVHRIGPHRINVKLARELGRAGYLCARFDLAGRGDSRVPADAAPFEQQAVSDIQSVMDHIAREHEIHHFALCGICSGAENAYAAALTDQRVVGTFLFDGYAYPTLRSRLIRQWSRLRSITAAKLARRLRDLPSRLSRRGLGRSDEPLLPPPPAEFAAAMETLAMRGVRVTLAYSGGGDYRYASQMADTFPGHRFVERIACHYMPDMDHVLTPLAAQRRYIALVREWVASVEAPRP